MTPCRDGIRRSRWVVIRNTYPELTSTTIKTWLEWFGPDNGLPDVVYDAPIRWRHRFTYQGAPDVDLEVLFLSMDRLDHIKKLKSLEATGIWMNEASELLKATLDMATARVGRYPHAKDKPDDVPKESWPSWYGVVMDTNSPDDDHWWYTLSEEEQPEGFEFFVQPGGFHALAENLEYLPGGRSYYSRMSAGKSATWIKVFVDGEYGSIHDGLPVWPEFSEAMHVAKKPLGIYRGLPLWLGFDFGLTPACVALQMSPRGQVRVLREWVTQGGTMGIRQFCQTIVKPALQNEFAGMKIIAKGDPGGAQRSQNDETTAIDVVKGCGIPCTSARTNLFTPRRDAVANQLSRLVDGEPAFLIDPGCSRLRKGMNGGYRFKRVAVPGEERYKEEPDKNQHSHVSESLQYPMLHITGEIEDAKSPPRRTRRVKRVMDREFGY